MNKLLKKLICIILCIILITPSISIQTVKAATLTANLNRHLSVSTIGDIPINNVSGAQEDQATLIWNIGGVNVGYFEVAYPLDNGNNEIVFKVFKENPNRARIEYEYRRGTQFIGINSFMVHSDNGSGFENFISFRDYDRNTADLSVGSTISNGTEIPMFVVSPGTGFSFMYENANVHFLWEQQTDNIVLTTNRINAGNIYPFTLKDGPNFEIAQLGEGSTVNVLPGLNQNTMDIIPFANNKISSFSHNNDVINMLDDPTIDPPGSPQRSLEFHFDMPLYWNSETTSFSALTMDNPDITEFPVILNLGNSIEVSIPNILVPDGPIPDVTIRPTDGTVSVIAEKENDRIKLDLLDLEAGTIYNPTTFVLTSGGMTTRTTNLPFGSVFTFIEYEVIIQDGSYVIRADPFTNHDGFYMLKEGFVNQNSLSPSVIQESNGTNPLFFPLTITSENEFIRDFEIYFSPGENFANNDTTGTVFSQRLRYAATRGDINIGTPSGFNIISHNLRPTEDSINGDTAFLDMRLRWIIGSLNTINALVDANAGTLTLNYDINNALVPNSSTENFANVLITITRDDTVSQGALRVSFTDDEGKVVPGQEGFLQSVHDPLTNLTSYEVVVDLTVDAARIGTVNTSLVDFIYPNIYFINIQPVRQNGEEINVSASVQRSITLNDISMLSVPAPQNILAHDPVTTDVSNGFERDEVSFRLNFDLAGSRIREFINSLPISEVREIDVDILTNIYISQNEDFMRDIFNNLDYPERLSSSAIVPYNDNYGEMLFFSDINNNTGMSINGFRSPLDALRNSDVVAITDLTLSDIDKELIINNGSPTFHEYILDGLDKNQQYFIYLDTVVLMYDENGELITQQASNLSALESILTRGDIEIPDIEDKIPPAPNLNINRDNLNEAEIYWDPIAQLTDDDIIEYEIIRLEGSQMDDRFLNDRANLEVFWNDFLNYSDKIAFRTDNLTLLEFDGNNLFPADESRYEYSITNTINFTDRTTLPNRIYFYYVRTVSINENNEIYSVWSNISFTTSPVQGPINLIALTNRDDYNPLNEIIISFDAPISDLSQLGSEYSLQYQLREGDNSWGEFVTMNPQDLIDSSTPSSLNGYLNFIYKITGLRSSSIYRIRVRIITSNGDASAFSNEIQIRTEHDQDDFDNQDDFDSWLDYLKNELMKLLRDPYWIGNNIRTSNNSFRGQHIVYRPSMFDQVMSETIGNLIDLVSPTDDLVSYYLPATIVREANQNNKGFRISYENMDVILPPNTINLDSNLVVRDISQDRRYTDYFIQITLDFRTITGEVEGNEPLTKELTLDIIGLATVENINRWDNNMLENAIEKILSTLDDSYLSDDIRDLIDNEISNEEMVREMFSIVQDVRRLISNDIVRNLNAISRDRGSIDTLDSRGIIAVRNINNRTSVNAFFKQNNLWMPQEVVDFGSSSRAIYISRTGIYIFTGNELIILGIESVTSGNRIISFVARYGLDDFFGRGDAFNLNAAATRSMVINSIARIAGAPRTENAIRWLNSNKNMQVSSRDMNGNITTEEAIYLVMKLYEVTTNTRINTVRITNYTALNQLNIVTPAYRQYIMAAYQLGFYNDTNIQPQWPITIQQVLELLATLDEKVGL